MLADARLNSAASGPRGTGMTIAKALVVDDSKVVRVMFKRMLEARGLGVETAASGQEAIDHLKEHSADVIFMDYMMPAAAGFEVTTMIVGNPKPSSIRWVMSTANDTPNDRARAKVCGASGFLTKPIGEAALDVVLAEMRERAPVRARAAVPVAQPASAAAGLSREEISEIARQVAHEVAQKLVQDAI